MKTVYPLQTKFPGGMRMLLAKLEFANFDLILRERMLLWFGHVERSSGAVRRVCDVQVDGVGQGGPR